MICRRYWVSGRVQGVFFRASARQQALTSGLHGWVRNRQDGRVELLVWGEANKLQLFENWLEIGPEHAKVTNIEVMQENDSEIPQSFEIWPTASTGE